MSRYIYIVLLVGVVGSLKSQTYTTANAHSHNDYEQDVPFYKAWEHGFGSIEADVFLVDGKLIVAHDSVQTMRGWTLDSLYLQPLQRCIERNDGFVYADSSRPLQLMIDIKSDAASSLRTLIELFRRYPLLTNATTLQIVISGNRPGVSQFNSYPGWILFDGELQKKYKREELLRIPMISDNFQKYSHWKGEGGLPKGDKKRLQREIAKVHSLGKKVRFWNAPDSPGAWKVLMDLGVDYINTDRIEELAQFLQFHSRNY